MDLFLSLDCAVGRGPVVADGRPASLDESSLDDGSLDFAADVLPFVLLPPAIGLSAVDAIPDAELAAGAVELKAPNDGPGSDFATPNILLAKVGIELDLVSCSIDEVGRTLLVLLLAVVVDGGKLKVEDVAFAVARGFCEFPSAGTGTEDIEDSRMEAPPSLANGMGSGNAPCCVEAGEN